MPCVPLNLHRRPLERIPARPDRPERGPRRFEGGRENYRSGPREGGFGRGAAPADKAGAPGAYQPQFGGFGRGGAPQ